jgi:hypothetical protein
MPFGPPPAHGHVGDKVERLRVIFLVGIPFLFFDVILFAVGLLPSWSWPLVLLGTVGGVIALGYAVAFLAERSAHGFMRTLLSSGGERHTHGYSAQESLVMRGHFDEAIASYHHHIAHTPADLDARLRLAELLAKEGNDLVAAEAMYLEVRVLGPSLRQDVALSNGLIDLYRRNGAQEQLKGELARFARRHEGSVEGRSAQRYLRQLAHDEASDGQD